MGSYDSETGLINEAAWSRAAKANVLVGPAEVYEPGPREMLVRVESIAFSPVDFKNQKFLLHPMPFPGILGSSFGGTVETVGQDVHGFKQADKVACNRPSYAHDDHRFGAFQRYALSSVDESSRLEPQSNVHDGAATLVNLSVAVSALSYLGVERSPIYDSDTPKDKTLLVYGGSSSTGGYAVKYASMAGYKVVTTSSPNHRDFVAELGANVVIDHTQPEDGIVAELAKNGPYEIVFDSIGLPPVTNILCSYLAKQGGEYATLLPPLGGERPIPENVTRTFKSWSSQLLEPQNQSLGRWFYQEYAPKALASGSVVPTRQLVVEGGLSAVQETIDRMGPNGVSGQKLMLDPR